MHCACVHFSVIYMYQYAIVLWATWPHARMQGVADSNSGASDEKYIARQFAVATVIPLSGQVGGLKMISGSKRERMKNYAPP